MKINLIIIESRSFLFVKPIYHCSLSLVSISSPHSRIILLCIPFISIIFSTIFRFQIHVDAQLLALHTKIFPKFEIA